MQVLLQIRELALDSIDGAIETRGSDSRWTRVTEMVDDVVRRMSK